MKLDEMIEYLEGTDDKRKQKFNMSMCPVDWVLPYLRTLLEIKKQSRINCEEICGRNYDTCKDKDCLTKQIINIIDKVKVKEDKL